MRPHPGIVVRPYGPEDAAALEGRELRSAADAETLVADAGGEAVGAAVVADAPFEREQLGIASARVASFVAWAERAAALNALAASCRDSLVRRAARFAACRIGGTDRDAAVALEAAGFVPIETIDTFSLRLPAPVTAAGAGVDAAVGLATADDAAACGEVAAACFTQDRFHADPRIDDRAADRLKRAWAENDCRGRADTVFVARDVSGRVVGFNACLAQGELALIDLIGVHPAHQGRRLGRALVAAGVAHYSGRCREMRVGTQSTNATSQALYRAAGFRYVDSARTFHLHSDPMP